MLNKFFQSFNEKKDKNDNHSFESDLYNLIYEIIIADHEISEQEINFASELVEFYFKIPIQSNKEQFTKLANKQHFNTDLSQFSYRLKNWLIPTLLQKSPKNTPDWLIFIFVLLLEIHICHVNIKDVSPRMNIAFSCITRKVPRELQKRTR